MNKIISILVILLFTCKFIFSQNLLSEGKSSWSSSQEGEGMRAAMGNDGNSGSRWASNYQESNPDDAWWSVDLGKSYHIARVEFDWEAAYATEYEIQLSDDVNFDTFEVMLISQTAKVRMKLYQQILIKKGRYVRMQGIARATGYGYSFWECRVYGMENLTQTSISIDVPYVQYLKLKLNPSDLNETNEVIIQNKNEIVSLDYNVSSPLSIDLLDFRGDFDIEFWSLKENSTTDTIKGMPLEVFISRYACTYQTHSQNIFWQSSSCS